MIIPSAGIGIVLFDIVKESLKKLVIGKRSTVSNHDQFFPCTCHGHIHPPCIRKKANRSAIVTTHQTHDDDITFLPLKPVDGVYCNKWPPTIRDFSLFQAFT